MMIQGSEGGGGGGESGGTKIEMARPFRLLHSDRPYQMRTFPNSYKHRRLCSNRGRFDPVLIEDLFLCPCLLVLTVFKYMMIIGYGCAVRLAAV